VTLLADAGGEAVAGMYYGIVGQSEEFGQQRLHDFFHRATPQIGTPDAAREKRVSSEENRSCDGDLACVGRKEETGTTRRMTGRVNHLRCKIAPLQRITFTQEVMHFGNRRRLDAEKAGLHFHRLIERNIVAVHQNRSAGVIVKFLQAADVVNVGVRADDGFYGESVAAEDVHDAVDFVAGVEDDGFPRDGIADDGAIALQQADRNSEVQHALAVLNNIRSAIFCTASIRHVVSIAFARCDRPARRCRWQRICYTASER